jgi:hypothetical protein
VTSGLNTLIGIVSVPPLPGCGSARQVGVLWPKLAPGVHHMRMEVGSSSGVGESSRTNNILTATVVVGTHGVFLPSIKR